MSTGWIFFSVVAALALFAGWGLAVFYATVTVDDAMNRQAAPGLIEQNEQKRIDALRRVADRQRLAQQRREGSARITRGW